MFEELSSRHRLVRFDGRGLGLSDWNAGVHGFERYLEDFEAVVEAAGLARFSIIGLSQGCAMAVAYAARHPERVDRLVLLGGYAQGWRVRGDPAGAVIRRSGIEMMLAGWGRDNPAVRQMFTALYMPNAAPEAQSWFTELQRRTASAENAAATLDAYGDIDVTGLLAKVQAPTLVIHSRNDAGVPYEQGQMLAAGIPGARFATLDTANHILPAEDPAWQDFVGLIRDFLAEEAHR